MYFLLDTVVTLVDNPFEAASVQFHWQLQAKEKMLQGQSNPLICLLHFLTKLK